LWNSYILHSLSLTKKPEPLTLGATDTLKLTFQVTESDEGKGVQPHQTFLRFYDKVSGEEGIQPVRVTPGGKAKFELVRFIILTLPKRFA
jgi:oligosaccharyltransferase complex subunit delta (ribophorin II)